VERWHPDALQAFLQHVLLTRTVLQQAGSAMADNQMGGLAPNGPAAPGGASGGAGVEAPAPGPGPAGPAAPVGAPEAAPPGPGATAGAPQLQPSDFAAAGQ
jgi:hypothetical protein